MKRLLALLLAALLAASSALAALPGAEHFYRGGRVRDIVLSPDGSHLAIVMRQGEARPALFVLDLAPGGKLVRVAHIADADVVAPQWVNNQRLVFQGTDTSAGSGAVRGGPGLFAVNRDGSAPRMLIERISGSRDGEPGETALSNRHSLGRVLPMRDGQPNNEVLVYEFNERSFSTGWLNVDTGRKRRSGHALPDRTTSIDTDTQGEPRIAYSRDKDDTTFLWWRGPGDADWRQLASSKPLEDLPFAPLALSKNGTLYVTQKRGPAGEDVLTRFDFAKNAPEERALVATPGFDFTGSVILHRDTGNLTGITVVTDAAQTIWLDPDMKKLQAMADERFPGRVNTVGCRRCGQPDQVSVVSSYSDRDPGSLWLHRAQPGEGQQAWTRLMQYRPQIDPAQSASMEFERIRARDGRDLPVWITRPANTPKGKALPAVVMVHGGPWVRGGNWDWNPLPQFLASRGYVVIEPEFRGSRGFGDAHFKASWKQWGQSMQDDVADALLWAQKQGLASDKACIAGASYGGYATLIGLVRHPELYRCGAAWVAVTDLELLVKGSWLVPDDSAYARKLSIPSMVGDPEKDLAMLIANSPVHQAAKIKAPVLLAMGELDVRVPLAHGHRMRDALTAAGNAPEYVVYPGEGHSWALLKHRVDFAERLERFLAKHLQ